MSADMYEAERLRRNRDGSGKGCLLTATEGGKKAAHRPDHGIFRQRAVLGLVLVVTIILGPRGWCESKDDSHRNIDLSLDYCEECTIGVANGAVTSDARPILWKVRDVVSEARQQLVHLEGSPYSCIGVCSEGGGIYMGLNEAGVASGNSVVKLSSGLASNSSVQRHILHNFATIDQIADYFASQQKVGVCNASGCFPFIDATGNAVVFEVDRSRQLWAYDSLAPGRQSQGLYGFVTRANEFHMIDDEVDDISIGGRYAAGVYNILGLIANDALSVKTLVQGRSDSQEYYELIRFGPGRELHTIARPTTRSAVVVHGTLPDEDPALTTMWVLLGQTNYSIAVPTWPRVSKLPECLCSGLMYDRARSLWAKGEEELTQASVYPLEAHLLDVVTETLLPHWRAHGVPTVSDMTRIENEIADNAYSLLDCLDNRQGNNRAPTPSFKAFPDGFRLSFICTAEDSDGLVTATFWDFGDGSWSSEVAPSHVYDNPGTYLVSCMVTDDDGVNSTEWRYFEVPLNVDLAANDGRATLGDFAKLTSFWQNDECGEPDWCGGADFDRSGSVDLADLMIMSQHWLMCIEDYE